MTTFIGADRDGDEFVRRLTARGLDVRLVTVGDDKATTLAAFRDGLDLPAWFGDNYDALADALGDLATSGRRVEVVLREADRLRRRDPAAYGVIRAVLEHVEEAHEGLHFTVIAG